MKRLSYQQVHKRGCTHRFDEKVEVRLARILKKLVSSAKQRDHDDNTLPNITDRSRYWGLHLALD